MSFSTKRNQEIGDHIPPEKWLSILTKIGSKKHHIFLSHTMSYQMTSFSCFDSIIINSTEKIWRLFFIIANISILSLSAKSYLQLCSLNLLFLSSDIFVIDQHRNI